MISHGSILDEQFVQSLGKYDIVYSWGVLHHTGSMWKAIDNNITLVRNEGRLCISLYAKGPRFATDLALEKNITLHLNSVNG